MRRSFLATAAVATSLIVLAGCSSGSSGRSGSDGTDVPQASEVVNGALPSDGPPEDGGILTVNDTSDPPTLDPQRSASAYTHSAVSGIVYSKLLEFETGRDIEYGSMGVRGDLAEKWDSSDQGFTWTFHLRKGVKWQNVAPVNGRAFTSADVACTMERLRTLPGIQNNLIEIVDSWATPDDDTFVFTLNTPYAAFDESMASFFMEILPCEGTRGEFDLAQTAIGTGPFILKEFQRKQQRTYVKNPDYFVAGKPHLDQIRIVLQSDPAASIAAFRTGQLDVTGSVTDTLLPTLTSTNPDAVARAQLNLSSTQVTMNQAIKPFDDVRVRKAVGMAWDRVGLGDTYYPDNYAVAGPFPSTIFGGMNSAEALKFVPYDPDAAKKLLAEAGYPNGLNVELMTTDGYGPTVVNGAQWVQEDLKKIGITTTLKVLDYATYFSTFAAKDYTMTYGISTGFLTADEWLNAIYKSDGPRNWFNSADTKVDEMINKQRATTDRDERSEMLDVLNAYIEENVLNPIIGFQTGNYLVMQPYVHNLYNHPAYARGYMVDVWLDSSAPSR